MTNKFAAAMRRAAKATRGFNVLGATRIIQKTLAKSMLSRLVASSLKSVAVSKPAARQKAPARTSPKPDAPVKTRTGAKSGEKTRTNPIARKVAQEPENHSRAPARLRRPLGEVLETLRKETPVALTLMGRHSLFSFGRAAKVPDVPVPAGASFVARSFTSGAGSRDFKLYVPASAPLKPKGLVVMLHGCTQNPDDFAAGTNMNALAETHGLLVAYPAQTRTSNVSSCWNWFEEAHQLRDAGEPAILAGLTRKLVAEFAMDRDRVFVAGLSAGAAMAVIMGRTYPDLFRGVGVHSGLAYQSAGNVMSAMAVMRGNTKSGMFAKPDSGIEAFEPVRTIIFHGTADRTVVPSNAQRIFDMANGNGGQGAPKTTSGSRNGRNFKQTVIATGNGQPIVESWLIDGAGHAWSGGKISGSYADPQGPDASAEMVRFFLNGK